MSDIITQSVRAKDKVSAVKRGLAAWRDDEETRLARREVVDQTSVSLTLWVSLLRETCCSSTAEADWWRAICCNLNLKRLNAPWFRIRGYGQLLSVREEIKKQKHRDHLAQRSFEDEGQELCSCQERLRKSAKKERKKEIWFFKQVVLRKKI